MTEQVQIQPFWQRVPKFFAVPMESPVLVRIGVLALAVPLAFLLIPFGLPGVLLLAAVWLLALVIGFQYGFRIIEQTARGFLRPSLFQPEFGERAISLRPYKYIAIYLLFGLAAAAMGYVFRRSEIVAVATWVLLTAFILPAATMRLTTTASLRAALNPAEIFLAMQRIGKPYLTLCLFIFFSDLCRTTGVLLIAGVGGIGLVSLSGGQATGVMSIIVVALIGLAFWYFTYLICALIGYAMYQYAGALNLSVVGQGDRQRGGTLTRKVDMRKRTRDSIVDTLASTGDVRDAIELVSDDLRQRPNDLSLHSRLHKLLLQEGSTPRIEAHADRFLDLLMGSDNAREALPLAQEALARNPQWEPRKLEHVVPLARAALAAGKMELVAGLIRGFDKKHRMHADIPNVYLIAAQMMMQTAGPSDQVRQILDLLGSRFAQHPAGAEAIRIRDRLSQMATPSVMRKPA